MWLLTAINLFAIAGGGGSSSGGGGGGGFSGGSSYSGGDSDSDGSGGSSNPVVMFIFFGIFIAVFLAIFLVGKSKAKKVKLAQMQQTEALKKEVDASAQTDAAWQSAALLQTATETFLKYQKDWSDFNLEAMKLYMSPKYYQRNLLMMGALKLIQRQNIVSVKDDPHATFVKVHDDTNNSQDSYEVNITASVDDTLIDIQSSGTLFKQPLIADEYYRFSRVDSKWVLDGIDQPTAETDMQSVAIRAFSDAQGYFYSLDWGHLLLPRRGQLFSEGTFGVSDINNHVIGLDGETIIQFYTYIEKPQYARFNFIIAQVAVPKNYGNIVVRKHKATYKGSTRGLKEVKTEWDAFNKEYQVFASNEEQATSFELLNPVFMEKLEALPFEVNIEVVDNIVYLYAPYITGTLATGAEAGIYYEKLLEILRAAYKEMRM